MNVTFGERGYVVQMHGLGASTAAEDCHSVRVPSELGDLALNPLQCHDLILEPLIARGSSRSHRQEPYRVHSI